MADLDPAHQRVTEGPCSIQFTHTSDLKLASWAGLPSGREHTDPRPRRVPPQRATPKRAGRNPELAAGSVAEAPLSLRDGCTCRTDAPGFGASPAGPVGDPRSRQP